MTAPGADWLPRGAQVALDDGRARLSYDALHERIGDVAAALRKQGLTRVASLADNAIDWLVADLAMLEAGIVHVPLAGFFTPTQVAGACHAAGVEAVLVAEHALASISPGLPQADLAQVEALDSLRLVRLAMGEQAPYLPKGTVKVTFTSGSTGAPKGVCLSREALLRVVDGVSRATATLDVGQHLSALPLPVLLENVAGAMVALAKGATVHLRPVAKLGWRGAADFDAALLDRQVRQTGAQSLIVMPQMLQAWAAHLALSGELAAPSLRLVAVGGAMVGERLIAEARAVGLPAFEGYGLSEGCSVQTLNLPGADRPGSVGRCLPHAKVRVDEHGELHVSGALALGYVGQAPTPQAEWPTGDVGHVDADGFVWVRGRRDNLIITGLGRNVSPEWVESCLRGSPCIGQTIVLPDAAGGLRAVIWPAAEASDEDIEEAVAAAHLRLPDYARPRSWQRALHPLDAGSGLATPGGKPIRAAIAAAYADVATRTRQHSHP